MKLKKKEKQKYEKILDKEYLKITISLCSSSFLNFLKKNYFKTICVNSEYFLRLNLPCVWSFDLGPSKKMSQ